MEALYEKQQKAEDEKVMLMEQQRMKNDKILALKSELASDNGLDKKRISKRAQKKLDKVKSDGKMSEFEKSELLREITLGGKPGESMKR